MWCHKLKNIAKIASSFQGVFVALATTQHPMVREKAFCSLTIIAGRYFTITTYLLQRCKEDATEQRAFSYTE